MSRLSFALLCCAVVLLLTGLRSAGTSGRHYHIPEQYLDLGKMMNSRHEMPPVKVPRFKISRQVTLKEYKEYLRAVEIDSSRTFYLSQLPGDGLLPQTVWEKYLKGTEYESYPVLGVSWEQAMNYCRWRTIRDNPENKQFRYRLPHNSEWLAALHYLSAHAEKHDFNQHYADWLINMYDETWYSIIKIPSRGEWPLDQVYDHKPHDPAVLRRKTMIGNNFLFQTQKVSESMGYGFNDRGYRYVGFRYVTEYYEHEKE